MLSALGPPPGSRLWAFGYADLARFLRTTEPALRQRVRRGQLDPSDLEALYRARRALDEGAATL